MQRRVKMSVSILPILLFVMGFILLLPSPAYGGEENAGSVHSSAPDGYTSIVDVDYYSGTNDAATAINAALATAKSTNEAIHIFIPAGEHVLNDILRIYSDTDLLLDDDTVLIMDCRDGSKKKLIEGRHVMSGNDTRTCPGDGTYTHGGYSQLSNITIRGGKWVTGEQVGD